MRIIAISTAFDNWSPGPGPGPGPGGIVAKEAPIALDVDGPPETDEVADAKLILTSTAEILRQEEWTHGGGGGGAGDIGKSLNQRLLLVATYK